MPEEIEKDKLLIHHWQREKNDCVPVFNCDYWDCPHKIKLREIYYVEIYPGGQSQSYCLECSAFFLAQAVNTLMEGHLNDSPTTDS